MSTVDTGSSETFSSHVPVLIVGAGAAGLCAALAAKEEGVEAVVMERDAVPSGSTALSAGLIPAAGTRFQRAKGIDDNPATFAADIQRKAKGEADPAVVEAVAQGAGLWSSSGWPNDTGYLSMWSTISTIPAIQHCACTAFRAGQARN